MSFFSLHLVYHLTLLKAIKNDKLDNQCPLTTRKISITMQKLFHTVIYITRIMTRAYIVFTMRKRSCRFGIASFSKTKTVCFLFKSRLQRIVTIQYNTIAYPAEMHCICVQVGNYKVALQTTINISQMFFIFYLR